MTDQTEKTYRTESRGLARISNGTEPDAGRAPALCGADAERPAVTRTYILPTENKKRWQSIFGSENQSKKTGFFRRLSEKGMADGRIRRRAVVIFWTLVGLILVAACLWPALRILSGKLVVREVRQIGTSPYTESELLAAAGIERGDSLLFFRHKKAEEAMLKQLPYLTSCRIRRSLPDGLTVTVTSESAMLFTSFNGEYYAISGTMRVLERRTDGQAFADAGILYAELPRTARLVVGERLALANQSSDAFIAELIERLGTEALLPRVTALDLGNKFDLRVELGENLVIRLGSPEELELKLLTARKILDGKDPDLRTKTVVDVTVPRVACVRSESGSLAAGR